MACGRCCGKFVFMSGHVHVWCDVRVAHTIGRSSQFERTVPTRLNANSMKHREASRPNAFAKMMSHSILPASSAE